MGDLTTGAYLALGAAFVAGTLWLLRTGFRSAVSAEFKPLADALIGHMAAEENGRVESLENQAMLAAQLDAQARQLDAQDAKLDAIYQQKLVDHAKFDQRLHDLDVLYEHKVVDHDAFDRRLRDLENP